MASAQDWQLHLAAPDLRVVLHLFETMNKATSWETNLRIWRKYRAAQ